MGFAGIMVRGFVGVEPGRLYNFIFLLKYDTERDHIFLLFNCWGL